MYHLTYMGEGICMQDLYENTQIINQIYGGLKERQFLIKK